MKSLVIFDLDGTLLNTIEDLGHAVNYALERLGLRKHSIESYRMMVGNGIKRLIERALPDDSRDTETVAEALQYFKGYYDEHLYDYTQPYPGIRHLLERLSADGINLAVASNKYQEATQRLIQHFFPNENFRTVHGNRDGVPRKPDPSVVFGVLTDCPTPKAEVLYVGDSAIDVETARRACVDSVAVTWGFRPKSELTAAYPMHIVTSPEQIIELI